MADTRDIRDIPDDRPLTPEEDELTRWMLAHGGPAAARHLADLDAAHVVSRCGCGCASVDFSVGGHEPPAGTPLRTLADYTWRDEAGRAAAVTLFARAGRLGRLELSALHPDAALDRLPAPAELHPFGSAPAT